MREATVLGLFLAVLLGLFAVAQMADVSTSVQAVTSGTLSQFIGAWPYLIAGIVLMIVVAFAVGAFSRK